MARPLSTGTERKFKFLRFISSFLTLYTNSKMYYWTVQYQWFRFYPVIS